MAREHALSQWRRTRFLATIRDESRGWLIETMACVERIGRSAFTLQDVYAWEAHLGALFPGNRHVREKIRQQLQRLRDNGYLRFTGNGSYELVRP